MFGSRFPHATLGALMLLGLVGPYASAAVQLITGAPDHTCTAKVTREGGRQADVVSDHLSTYTKLEWSERFAQLGSCNCEKSYQPCSTLAAPSSDGGGFFIDCADFSNIYDCCEDTWRLFSGKPLTSKPCKV